jgi:hypothetical protein
MMTGFPPSIKALSQLKQYEALFAMMTFKGTDRGEAASKSHGKNPTE